MSLVLYDFYIDDRLRGHLLERDSAFHLLQSQGDGLIVEPHMISCRSSFLSQVLFHSYWPVSNEVHGGLSLDMLISLLSMSPSAPIHGLGTDIRGTSMYR